MTAEGTTTPAGPWAPLRSGVFRALWLAVLASNIGTWMQTVGAQWLLVERSGGSVLVALVQTASTLPVLLLALPAGVLADVFDRRRLLLVVQVVQVSVGAALTVLTTLEQLQPALLLAFTFALGVGTALTAPAYQALIPDLVPRAQLPAAAGLGAVSMNVARAIGPALAGVIVAQVGVAAVFALNALSFLVFAVVLAAWRRPRSDVDEEPERFVAALRAGGRYVRHSLVMRRLLLRASLFLVPATVLWALLAVVAADRLRLGASGYGLLLAALGVGAVAGVFVMPRLRARLGVNQLLAAASLVYALSLVATILVPNEAVVLVALVPAGLAWVAVLTSINVAIQLFLPVWVRARGIAVYQMTFFGAQAVGAVVWGLLAQHFGLVATFIGAAALLAVGAATGHWLPLHDVGSLDRSPAIYWPEPRLDYDPTGEEGPVIVTVTYTVPTEQQAEFRAAMEMVRRSRLRSGAVQWGLYRSGEDPRRVVEFYVVGSWSEHLRQHGGRLTAVDQDVEEQARIFVSGSPEVVHLFPVDAPAR